MRKLVYIALLLALCLACTDRQAARRLDRAQSLADSLPAEARGILDSLRPQLSGLSRSQLMRYHLTRIQADNLLDSTLHEDSLMRQVAEYYDDHGTANERMLAYYLLGRTYSDMGEAPQALQAFHDAIDRADTTSSDCDYRRLSRIYGQMASLFQWQKIPDNSLYCLSTAARYSKRGKDTLSYLTYCSLKANLYEEKGNTDSVLLLEKRISTEFYRHGYVKEAIQSLPFTIKYLLENKHNKEAGKLLHRYEEESGLFEENGDITKGYESYYFLKGLYLLNIDKLDSAEYYFRKEYALSNLTERQNGSEGLYMLYKNSNQLDSALKYIEALSSLKDTLYRNMQTENVQRISSLYNYSRMQDYAAKKEKEATATRFWLVVCIISSITLILFISIAFYGYNKRNKERIVQRVKEKINTIKELELAKTELEVLSSSRDKQIETLIKEKEEAVKELEAYTKSSMDKGKPFVSYKENRLFSSAVLEKFRKVSLQQESFEITKSDWLSLEWFFYQAYPLFKTTLLKGSRQLTEAEIRLCILVHLHFATKQVALLIGKSQQQVSNMKKNLSSVIFGVERGSARYFDDLINLI